MMYLTARAIGAQGPDARTLLDIACTASLPSKAKQKSRQCLLLVPTEIMTLYTYLILMTLTYTLPIIN